MATHDNKHNWHEALRDETFHNSCKHYHDKDIDASFPDPMKVLA